jgi:protease IV
MTDDTVRDSPSGAPASAGVSPWERQLLEKVVTASLQESRRARRWGIFFKALTFLYLLVLLALLVPQHWSESLGKGDKHTALVEVEGVILPGGAAAADKVIKGLREAFEDGRTKGVILRINSPGGSPVQAGYIHDEILRLKAKYPQIPVYAVVMDVCASGGYYVAVAADKIYADKGSLVGSIGVRMDGFGFVDTLRELGVERRLLTAGARKGILDPFSPLPEADRLYIQNLLDQLHGQFIEVVRKGRGERLKDSPELFSGLFWSGEQGVGLGLVDGLGSSGYVARELIGAEDIVDFTREDDLFERLAHRVGAGIASGLGQLAGVAGGLVLR